MPSANDYTAAALKLLGVIDPTETPSAEDNETGFDVLNDWIDWLGTQRQSIYFLTRTTQTLSASTASYTIGTGGTINIVRPEWLEPGMARLILNTGDATPTEVRLRILTDAEYAAWAQKTQTSSITSAVWYDHNWSSGLARIYVLPIPSVGTTQLVLYTPTALIEFADQSTVYTFPKGYRRAITLNLAVELARHYPGATMAPDLNAEARQVLKDIKRVNFRPVRVQTDPGAVGPSRRGGLSRSEFESGTF